MSAHSSFRKNCATSEARPALGEFLEILKQHAEVTPTARLAIHIYSRQDARVIRELAQKLPSTAVHFQGGSGKDSMTAADFLERSTAWKLGGFWGALPNCPDAWGAIQMLDDVLRIADVRFEATLFDIQWRGSPAGWRSWLEVRGTAKKGRKYYLEFVMKHPSVALKEEAQAAWKQVKAVTGLNFARGAEFFDDSLKDGPDLETYQGIDACFNEALFEAREELLARGLRWNDFAGVKMHKDAFDERQMAWGTGSSERISFDGLIRGFMKRTFPEFEPRGGGGGVSETLWFAKPLTSSTHFRLHIDKIHGHGLGKTFELKVGVEFPGADFRGAIYTADVFRLFRCGDTRQWTYGTLDEFNVALGGLEKIIREAAPALERTFRKWLSQMPRRAPDFADHPRHLGLTAREALVLAEPVARQWRADAYLRSVAGAAVAGRSMKGGYWRFEFEDPADPKWYCRVKIPGVGRIDWAEHAAFYGSKSAPFVLPRDSPEGWAVAERLAAEEHGPCVVRYVSIGKRTWHFTLEIPEKGQAYLVLDGDTMAREQRGS